MSKRVERRQKPYFWFQGDSVIELVRRLTEAGPETARLEVRTDASGKKMTLRVVPAVPQSDAAATEPASDINDSFLCPPIC